MSTAKKLIELLSSRHYKPNYTPVQEQIVLKIDDKTIATRNNFITFSGLAKAGKSNFLSNMISSAYIWNNSIFGMSLRPPEEAPYIAYFDTESSEYDWYRMLEKIRAQANIKELPVTFNAYNVRQDNPELIRELIEFYLKSMAGKCSIVIIDGYLDIINDFNDNIESKKIIQWLKYLTKEYNVCIIGVIHLARKENGLLGHFGSMLERYSQSVLEVVKDRELDIIELRAKYLRSDKDFNPIAVRWTDKGFERTVSIPVQEIKKPRK